MFFRIVVLLPAELLHVRNLIDKTTASGSEPKLPVVRVKADYYGFSTIIPQRFGQKYIGKVANPNLVFSRSTQRHQKQGLNLKLYLNKTLKK